jgi:hypothetical protein
MIHSPPHWPTKVARLERELRAALAREAEVVELHTPSPLSGGDCATCRVPHPCRTRRLLAAAPEQPPPTDSRH